MARFTLAILPDGRALISSPDKLTDQQVKLLREVFATWSTAQPAEALIVGECDVIRVADVQLELEPVGAG